MNQEQFDNNLRSVFEGLKESGLDIQSNIYRLLMSLYANFKLKAQIADQAIDKNVELFQELQSVRSECILLRRDILRLTQKNSALQK